MTVLLDWLFALGRSSHPEARQLELDDDEEEDEDDDEWEVHSLS